MKTCPLCGEKFTTKYNNSKCILSNIQPNSRYKFKFKWYYIRNLLFNRYDLIRTKLSKGSWHDTDEKMLYGIMNLIVEFVEQECDEYELQNLENDFINNVSIRNILLQIYIDWKVTRPQLIQQIQEARHIWYEARKQDKTNVDIPEWQQLKDLEQQLDNLETKMLHQAIDIREYLWT